MRSKVRKICWAEDASKFDPQLLCVRHGVRFVLSGASQAYLLNCHASFLLKTLRYIHMHTLVMVRW